MENLIAPIGTGSTSPDEQQFPPASISKRIACDQIDCVIPRVASLSQRVKCVSLANGVTKILHCFIELSWYWLHSGCTEPNYPAAWNLKPHQGCLAQQLKPHRRMAVVLSPSLYQAVDIGAER